MLQPAAKVMKNIEPVRALAELTVGQVAAAEGAGWVIRHALSCAGSVACVLPIVDSSTLGLDEAC